MTFTRMNDTKDFNPEVTSHNEDGQEAVDGTESVDLANEVERLRQELARAEDQLLRKAAEFQNYRRRTEEEKLQLVQIGKSSVVEQLLDVVDDFARSVEASRSEGATVESIAQGIEMVYEKLMGELKRIGVTPIEAVGRPFDENEHDALMRQPAPEGVEPGTVLEEIQRGYRMDDRVLRHSRVVVASEQE